MVINGIKCPFLLTCACTTLHLACAVAMSWHHGRHWTDYRATLDASSHAQLLLSGSELIISLSAACWCSPFEEHQQQSHSRTVGTLHAEDFGVLGVCCLAINNILLNMLGKIKETISPIGNFWVAAFWVCELWRF